MKRTETLRKILHLDLDAFFCAVEEQRDPALRGRPFAVGGRPEARGVVASCSYVTRRFGVRSAMPMARAVRLCPELIVIPHRHREYTAVSRQVMARLHEITTLVEQVSIDEAFLDVSELREPGEAVARRLQARINQELGLPCSLGVATNKLLAKTASDVGKAAAGSSGPPNAITVVPPGQEAAFLAPLPVEALWGVGPKTAARLAQMGVRTIGDLAAWPEADLVRRFGKVGGELALRARGVDPRPIVTARAAKSISKETTFARDVRDGRVLLQTLMELSQGVGRRLRDEGLMGSTVKLKLRWPDFTTLTRQQTLEQPADQDEEILAVAEKLLYQVWRPGRAVRLVGVGVSGLGPRIRQLSLWEAGGGPAAPPGDRDPRLQAALAALQERFGVGIVRLGVEGRPGGSGESEAGEP